MLAALDSLSQFQGLSHWAVTLSHWPCLVYLPLHKSVRAVEEPTSLQNMQGTYSPMLVVMLLHSFISPSSAMGGLDVIKIELLAVIPT